MLRRVAAVLALFGVLLHAGASVRHQSVMLDALRQHQALISDLHALCNASGGADAAGLPYVPRPTDAQSGCPICSGLVSAIAIAAPEFVLALAPRSDAPDHPVAVAALAQWAHVHPPVRGPPAQA